MNNTNGTSTNGDAVKSTNGASKWAKDYLLYPDKEVKNLCRKMNLPLEGEMFDIVKNVMWAADEFLENAPKIKNKQVNIYVHWTVDPDSLASAKLLGELFLLHGANDYRILGGQFGHPQNLEMMNICHIVMFKANDGRFEKGLNCMVDVCPPLGERNTSPVDHTCKEFFFVCDHHDTCENIYEQCKSSGIKPITIPILGKRIGSTSSMMILFASCLKQLANVTPETKAALLHGIYSDTQGLLYNVTLLDTAMFTLINTGHTSDLFSQIQYYEYPEEWLGLKHRAYRNQITDGKIRLTTTGLTTETCRDVIAECANDILRQKNTVMAFCLAITINGLELSVRANSRLLKMEPVRIIQVVDDVFKKLFPGKSGFKFSAAFPHHIEGGACVTLESIDQIFLDIQEGKPDYNNSVICDKSLSRCKEYMESIIKVLQKMTVSDPELMAGLGIATS